MLAYAKNKLQRWINRNGNVSDEMLWKGSFGHQIMFVRDRLVPLVGVGLRYWDRELIPSVISTHHSKSIQLPVYKLERKDLGLTIILRDNFYNWKMSVISEKPIEADFTGLFFTGPPVDKKYTGDSLSPVYFEGFPEDLIFGYYNKNNKKWSAELHGDHALYTAIFLIMRSLGAVKPPVWHTEETHKKAMDEDRAQEKAQEEKDGIEAITYFSKQDGLTLTEDQAREQFRSFDYRGQSAIVRKYEDVLKTMED